MEQNAAYVYETDLFGEANARVHIPQSREI
jgi:hypothetical protein